MPRAGRRRSSFAVAASALAHLVVLAIALAQHPTIPIPDRPDVPSPDAITVQLARRPAPARLSRPAPLRLHRTPQAPTAPGLPVAPVRAAPTGPPAPAPGAPGIEAAPDLSPGLRHGLAGCANAALSRAERDLCNERLGRNMSREPFLPAPIQGRIRAYYDAVAEAKRPDPLPVPLRATGKLGVWDTRDWATSGHGPAIGCRIYFGVGKKPNPMPHALKLGPCYIEPPKGPLDPEVDITPP